MSQKLTALFISALATCAVSMAPSIDWEEFDAAIAAEDCFGSRCGKKSAALSMLQKTKAPKVMLRATSEEQKGDDLALSEDDLKSAFENDDESAVEAAALNLVQTGASVERVATPAAQASILVSGDGSFEKAPEKVVASADGQMFFSVDGSATFHVEEGLSLMQTKAQVERKRELPEKKRLLSAQASKNTLKIRQKEERRIQDEALDIDAILADQEDAVLSLMQTDAHTTSSANKPMVVAANADGSLQMNPHKVTVPDDGKMFVSFDGKGDWHAEEGFSLIQTQARVEESPQPKQVEQVQWSDEGHPSWSEEASSEAEALSLIQASAHIERRDIQADGSVAISKKVVEVPTDGMMSLSVDGQGAFRYEI